MTDSNQANQDRAWQALLGAAPLPPADAGFTLRVLTALPRQRRRRERRRTAVLLLAVLIATVLTAVTLLPPLAQPTQLVTPLVAGLAMAALAFWTVFTVAD
jgi:hypothetical protein